MTKALPLVPFLLSLLLKAAAVVVLLRHKSRILLPRR
jgi:hypothetical protein